MKILFTLPLLALTINSLSQIPVNELTGYWPFNGNANDVSGNGNDGIVHGASLTSDRFDCTGSAYYFDGIDDYIEIGTLPGLIEHLNSYSISFWYKSGSDVLEWSSIIGSINNAPAEMAFEINFHRNGLFFQFGRISFIIRSNDDKYLSFAVYATETFGNQWHHIVFNFEDPAHNSASVFIDGIIRDMEYVTTEGPVNYVQFEIPFTLGATNNRGTINRFYKGCIDDFRIYGRILTKDEIKSLYHIGGWPSIDTDLIAFYPFNGNANDDSGNGYDGIVHGAILTEDRCGNKNSAYLFDGYTNYIELPSSVALNSDSSFSIEAWINNDRITSDGKYMNNAIFGQSDGLDGSDLPVILFEIMNDNSVRGELRGTDYPALDLRSQITIEDDTWYHIVMVRNAQEDNLAIYINGCLDSIGENQLVGNTISNDFVSIGAYFDDLLSLYHFFCGKIDEVRIYNRALSPEEISALYYADCYSVLINGESEVCQDQKNVRYYVNYYGCATSYTWNYSGTGVTINGSAESVLIDFESDATSGNLSVTITDNNMNTFSASILAIVNALPSDAGVISGDNEVCAGQNDVSYIIPAIDNATDYLWDYSGTGATIRGNSNIISIDFAENATSGNLTVNGSNSCGNGTISEDFFIEVSPCDVDTDIISIPNWFTPNGDGMNETWVIQGITAISKLMIFDRSGKKVYEYDNYHNDWDGRDNNGNPMPSDTYWYVIHMSGYPAEFKGWVYLMR